MCPDDLLKAVIFALSLFLGGVLIVLGAIAGYFLALFL